MKGLWHQTVDVAQDEGIHSAPPAIRCAGCYAPLVFVGFSHILAEAGTEDVRQVLAEHLGFREVEAVQYPSFESSGISFAALAKLDPVQFTRLSLMKRSVPSNLY